MRLLLLTSVLLAAACKQAPSTPAEAGKSYFAMAGCTSCHKIGSLGSAVGPDLTFVGFRQSADWMDMFLKDPRSWKNDTLMPNTRMTDEARVALVAYLKERKGQDWPKGERPWDEPALMKDPVARGLVIFNRAGCVACHGKDGLGGYPNNNTVGGLIPAINKVADGFSKAELLAKLRKGVPQSIKADAKGPAPMVHMPAWGEVLDDTELDAVASYLLSLKGNSKPDF